METLHDSENYLQQNVEAEVRTRLLGGWLFGRTFAVCLHQKFRGTTGEIWSLKGELKRH